MDQNKSNEVLTHHGVLGMRWGRRLYQNKDGSLTPLGRKRADKLISKYKKVTGKNVIENDSKQNIKRTVKSMTNEELSRFTNRLNMESNFIEASNRRNRLNPQEVSRGKRFINKLTNDVIVPAVTNAAREQTQKWLNRQFGKVLNNTNSSTKKTIKKYVETNPRNSDLQKQKEEMLKSIRNNLQTDTKKRKK